MAGCSEHGEGGQERGAGVAEWRRHPIWPLCLVRDHFAVSDHLHSVRLFACALHPLLQTAIGRIHVH